MTAAIGTAAYVAGPVAFGLQAKTQPAARAIRLTPTGNVRSLALHSRSLRERKWRLHDLEGS
jgi:hypothetical protein